MRREASCFPARCSGLVVRLMGSLSLASLLHCVTAAARGAAVMCSHYEIGTSRGLSATAGTREQQQVEAIDLRLRE